MGLARNRRLAPPQRPKSLVLQCEGVSWVLPKSPSIEKEKKKEGVRSVAPHHLTKASPLWFWRRFRDDVLTLLVWWWRLRGCSQCAGLNGLLRVVSPAQNARGGGGVSSFSEHYKSSNAATLPLHQADRVFAERALVFRTRRCSGPPRILGQQNDPQELMY